MERVLDALYAASTFCGKHGFHAGAYVFARMYQWVGRNLV